MPDQPDGTYSINTRGRSARRYYNPALPVDDPRREIADSTYFALRRRFAQSEDEEQRDAAVKAQQRQRNRARRAEYHRDIIDRDIAEQLNIPWREYRANVREQQIYNYTNDIFGMDRSAGGYLSTLLENLGWRAKGAWWPVGDSDRIIKQFGSYQNAIQWKSQSPIRGVVGYTDNTGEVA
jgi:hypothetical protein